MGHLISELVQRTCGISIGEFVRRELADFDFTYGLAKSEFDRAATLSASPNLSSTSLTMELSPLQIAALANPVIHPAEPNTEKWRAAELPSANGFASARGLARLYGKLASGGSELMSSATIRRASQAQISGLDAVMGIEVEWACGFLRNNLGIYGPNPGAFGHSGWGGSFAFADPENGLAVAYVMNHMGADLIGDPRAVALIDATYRSVKDA